MMQDLVEIDTEASGLLGETCRVCTQCGATSCGEGLMPVHFPNCAPPREEWFEEVALTAEIEKTNNDNGSQ